MAPQQEAGSLTVVPANQSSFGDVQAIFGTQGQASWCQCQCQCQCHKLAPHESRCYDESLLRNQKVPWSGRDEDKQDCTVCAITCLFARAGFRRQRISRALIPAAVRVARDRGARAIEAYPMTTSHAIDEELYCVSTQGSRR